MGANSDGPATYHGDVECIEEIKRQGCNEVDEEPGRGVVDADGAGIVHHLAGLTHVGGAEVQNNVYGKTTNSAESFKAF